MEQQFQNLNFQSFRERVKHYPFVCLLILVWVSVSFPQELKREAINFQNGDVQLSGTLFLPISNEKLPAVVILHGSGPDEGLEYKIYAEEFGKAGIATLVFDKRGWGKSGGDWRKRPFEFLAGDALAAVKHLQSRSEISPNQVGLWGISQGGWSVAYAAARSKDVAFVVSVAGNGITPSQQETWHKVEMYKSLGYSENACDTAQKFWQMVFDWLVLVDEGKFPLPKGVLENEISSGSIGMNYDPLPDWERITQPVLLIHGEFDKLSPANESISRISFAFAKNNNKNLTYKVFPKASHTITTNKTMLEFDWDNHFAPDYFKFTTDWVLSQTNQKTVIPKGDTSKFEPSPDFDDSGNFGKTVWYRGAYLQLGAMILFPIVFLIGFFASIISFVKNRRFTTIFTGLVCLFNFLLIVGFYIFLVTSIFPQGMNLTLSYSIPIWQKSLPLLGVINLLLTIILVAVFIKSRKELEKWKILVGLFGLMFIPWLFYWNLIGGLF